MTEVRSTGDYRMLLTSAGVTTDAMRDACRDMVRGLGERRPHVLRIMDAVRPFYLGDGVSTPERMEQRAMRVSEALWSRAYLKFALGRRAVIENVHMGTLDAEAVGTRLRETDMCVGVGGNTYVGMRSMARHAELLKEQFAAGLPAIMESGMTIAMGRTLGPASLAPADPAPLEMSPSDEPGLGIVPADIVVHVCGATGAFRAPRYGSRLVQAALAQYASSEQEVATYITARQQQGIGVRALTDTQALWIQGAPDDLALI